MTNCMRQSKMHYFFTDLLGESAAHARAYMQDVLNLDIFPPEESSKVYQVLVQKHELIVSLEISRFQLSKVEDQNQQLKRELERLQNVLQDGQKKIIDLNGELETCRNEKHSLEERLKKMIRN